MAVIFVIWAALAAALSGRRLAQRGSGLARLAATLSHLAALSRAGALDLREEARGTGLATVLDDARRAGMPVARSLDALARVALREERRTEAAVRLWRLFHGRLVAGVAVAVGVRLLAPATDSPADLAAGVAGTAIVLWVSATLLTQLRSSWLDAPTLSRWLTAHIYGTDPGLLQDLTQRELTLGVSLLGAKRRVLLTWASARHRDALSKLRRAEDWLPLAELLGVGLPLMLLLVSPGLSWFGDIL